MALCGLAAATLLAPTGCGLNRQGGLTLTGTAGGGIATTTSSVGGSTGGSGVGGPIFTGGGGVGALGGGGHGTAAAAGHGGENCLNGVDDDGDGQPDCADPDCLAGFGCYAIGPTDGTPVTQPAPTCPGGLTPTSYYDCAGCTCSPSAGYCNLSVTLYDRGDCTGSTQTDPAGPSGGCASISAFYDHSSDHVAAEANASPDGSQGCTAPTSPVAPTEYALCAAEQVGTGCGTNEVCLPSSERPWCVVVAEADACPLGTTVLGSAPPLYDSTGSGSCVCSCSTSVLCPGTQEATLYESSSSCGSGATFIVTPDDGCVDTQLSSVLSIDFERAPAVVYCDPNPSLAAANTLKLCCAGN